MRRKAHIIGSIIFAVIGTILLNIVLNRTFPKNIINLLKILLNMRAYIFLIMIMSSVFGGLIPDILDPPFTKRHRRYAHSKILFYIFIVILIVTSSLIIIKDNNLILWIIYYFLLGYISHLVLDSFTTAGLWG